jgi:hypothetical protein
MTNNTQLRIIGALVCALTPITLFASPADLENANNSHTQTLSEQQQKMVDITSAFRSSMDMVSFDIQVPTVVEVPIAQWFERNEFAVFDNDTQKFEPYYFQSKSTARTATITAQSQTSSGNPQNLVDNKYTTFVEYALPQERKGVATLVLSSDTPITSSRFSLFLDDHVALPTSIEIKTKDANAENIVVAKKRMTSQTVEFLETQATQWEITLEYGQPLRVAEARLSQNNVEETTLRSVRFLAQPEHTYRIYMDPDRSVSVPTGESSNLSSDTDVLMSVASSISSNPSYTKADVDEDGIPDKQDNCVNLANPAQEDINTNGRGDACDDFDKDGHINAKDNCPNVPNRAQTDTDFDGIGDACDDEESRITEKYVWLPWAGMGVAVLVIVMLFAYTIRGMRKNDGVEKNIEDAPESTPPQDSTSASSQTHDGHNNDAPRP